MRRVAYAAKTCWDSVLEGVAPIVVYRLEEVIEMARSA